MTLRRELLQKFLIRCGFIAETNNPASETIFRIVSLYRTFNNNPGIAIQYVQVLNQFIQVLGCVGNIKGVTDHSAFSLPNGYGALPIRDINTYRIVPSYVPLKYNYMDSHIVSFIFWGTRRTYYSSSTCISQSNGTMAGGLTGFRTDVHGS